jgi:hypothetical protein
MQPSASFAVQADPTALPLFAARPRRNCLCKLNCLAPASAKFWTIFWTRAAVLTGYWAFSFHDAA